MAVLQRTKARAAIFALLRESPPRPRSSVSAPAGAQQKAPAAGKGEQFFPVLVYRTGAYAPNGVPWANGYVDYLKLVNAQGGINGVQITFEECEFGYATDRGVECYERLKGKGPTGATLFHPLSTGVTFAITDKTVADKIPLITRATAARTRSKARCSRITSRCSGPTGARPTSWCSTSPKSTAASTS